jgi:hypothetical protein
MVMKCFCMTPSVLIILNLSETDVRKILTIAEHFKASDIFALSGRPILIRRYGRLYALTYTNIKGSN